MAKTPIGYVIKLLSLSLVMTIGYDVFPFQPTLTFVSEQLNSNTGTVLNCKYQTWLITHESNKHYNLFA
jgi:hypothetical protein